MEQITENDSYQNNYQGTGHQTMYNILDSIVKDKALHHRWLFTLSHLENCGTKKIMGMEPRYNPPLYLLDHASEEARHAYFFKKQIQKLNLDPDTGVECLGGMRGKNYLNHLEVQIFRLIREHLSNNKTIDQAERKTFPHLSYLLTTYVVELRAKWLYELYQQALNQNKVPINLLSVLKEEEAHLRQIEEQISKTPLIKGIITPSFGIEKLLFDQWLKQLSIEITH